MPLSFTLAAYGPKYHFTVLTELLRTGSFAGLSFAGAATIATWVGPVGTPRQPLSIALLVGPDDCTVGNGE